MTGEVAEVEDKVIEDEDEMRGKFASSSRMQHLHVKKIDIAMSLQLIVLFAIVLESKLMDLHVGTTDTHLAKVNGLHLTNVLTEVREACILL